MEKLKLTLIPQPGNTFQISVDNEETEVSELPFLDGGNKAQLLTILNALNALQPKYELNQNDDLNFLESEGLVANDDNGYVFHSQMRQKIGERIYQALFPSRIKSQLDRALERAKQTNQPLHIQIHYFASTSQETCLSLYPWHLAHDSTEFIAKRLAVFSYFIAYKNRNVPEPLEFKFKPVKILLISALSSQNGNQPIQSKERIILNVLKKAIDRGDVEILSWYDRDKNEKPTFAKLREYLESHSQEELPHVIHFDGHGAFKKVCTNPICAKVGTADAIYSKNQKKCESCQMPLGEAQGFLTFEDESGNSNYIKAETFANLISKSKPTLTIITSCRSALAYEGNSIFNGIVQSLQRDIPVVIGTPFDISVKSATSFVESFYRVLIEGQKSLLEAVKAGTDAMDFEEYEWYRPVIFMPHKGYDNVNLFNFNTSNISSEDSSSSFSSPNKNLILDDSEKQYLTKEIAYFFQGNEQKLKAIFISNQNKFKVNFYGSVLGDDYQTRILNLIEELNKGNKVVEFIEVVRSDYPNFAREFLKK